jgi:hypothetical protein
MDNFELKRRCHLLKIVDATSCCPYAWRFKDSLSRIRARPNRCAATDSPYRGRLAILYTDSCPDLM